MGTSIKLRESPLITPYHRLPLPTSNAIPHLPRFLGPMPSPPRRTQYFLSWCVVLRTRASPMAITHDDLSIRGRRSSSISSKLALLLLVLSILCGLSSFVLCLAAEATRSEAAWFIRSSPDDGKVYECVYSGSGRTPLACAVAAFLLLAVAMFTEHAYMLVAVTSPTSHRLVTWMTPADPTSASPTYKALTWQACFLFLATWICFAIAEVLLMIGIGVESGHLSRWRSLRSSCTAIRPGLFAAAGVLGLTTAFLGVGLYLTALRTQRLHQEEEGMHRGAPNVSSQLSAHWEPNTMGAYQTQHPQEGQSPSKTTTST